VVVVMMMMIMTRIYGAAAVLGSPVVILSSLSLFTSKVCDWTLGDQTRSFLQRQQ